MKNLFKPFAILFFVLAFVGCEKEKPAQIVNNDDISRTVIYSIGDNEGQRTLKNDSEWEALLDNFCDQSKQGEEVTFFSLGQHKSSAAKQRSTITTTNREELKQWMKEQEMAGKTVRVTFDSGTGTWNGTAYAAMPVVQGDDDCYTGVIECVEMPVDDYGYSTAMVPALRINDDTLLVLVKDGYTMLCGGDMGDDTVTLCGVVESRQMSDGNSYLVLDLSVARESAIVGNWQLTDMFCNGSELQVGEVYLDLTDDGTASLSGAATQVSNWSLSDEGTLCCDLIPYSNGCWNINWLSETIMIISCKVVGDDNCESLYVAQFQKITK